MERKRALVAAGAITFGVGAALIGAGATGHLAILGFGTGHDARTAQAVKVTVIGSDGKPHVVTRIKDVWDHYVVETPTTATSSGNGAVGDVVFTPGLPTPGGAPTTLPATGSTPTRGGTTPPASTPTGGAPATTVATAPTTVTTIGTTTTTWPPGVPADWPANQPIPPMPPNCRQPQLEDNGVWNCQQ